MILLGFVAVNLLATIRWPVLWVHVERGDFADRWVRRLGYVLVGALLWLFAVTWFARQLQESRTRLTAVEVPELIELAHELRPKAEITKEFITAPDGRTQTFLKLQQDTNTLYLINSDALTPPVTGYGGTVRIALLLRADGTLIDFRLIHSHETPSYVHRIASWLGKLKARSLTSSDALAHVDAVSGATYTTRAILQTLRRVWPAFAEKILHQPPVARAPAAATLLWRDGLLALVLLLPLVLRWWPRRTLAVMRWLWLALVLGFIGFRLNAQYSLHHLTQLLRGDLPPPALSTPFLLAVAVPLLIALFGNYYCGWLCPFGAAQELAGSLWPRRWRLDPRKPIWRWARWLKFVLLTAAALAIACGFAEPVQRADPLATIFSGFAEKPVLFLGLAMLILSIFFGRFWCRNLCPVGAFLAWLGAWRPLRRFAPVTAPGSCDYGVQHHRDLDCLQCDRCRRARASPTGESAHQQLRPREIVFLLAVGAGAIFFIHSMVMAAREFPSLGNSTSIFFQASEKSLANDKLKLADPAALKKINAQIQQKKLSDHEAKYYKPLPTP